MRRTLSGWEVELAHWMRPFVDRLGTPIAWVGGARAATTGVQPARLP